MRAKEGDAHAALSKFQKTIRPLKRAPTRSLMHRAVDLDGLVFLEFDLGGKVEGQLDLFQAQADQQRSQFLLHHRVELACQAGVVCTEFGYVQRVAVDLPVNGLDADLGIKTGAVILLVARPASEPGADLVRRQLFTAVGLYDSGHQLEFHLGFAGAFGFGGGNQFRLEQRKLDMVQYELVE